MLRLSSQIYRHAFRRAAVVVILMLLLLWSAYAFERYRQYAITRDRLTEAAADIVKIYQSKGIEGLQAYGVRDGSRIWTEHDAFDVFEQDDILIRVIGADSETVIGYDALEVESGYSSVYLDDHELDHHPLTALGRSLQGVPGDDDVDVMVARFFPDYLFELAYKLRVVSWLLVALGLILSVCIAQGVNRLVSRRLSALKQSASTVAKDGFTHRIPVGDDNDEFNQVASEINSLVARAESLTKNMRDVTVGVAHDLKTPLSNISGRLQLIERDAADSLAVLSHTDVANQHINTLKGALDALLRLGEVESGARRAAFAPVDLSAVAQDMADSFLPVFEEADKTLNVEISAGINLTGDRELLMQLINNLLENTLEHARDGAIACIRLQQIESQIQLQMEDDGPGIPEQYFARVFERFYRMDSSRGGTGNGLGLSLVKSIAELHGGGAKVARNGSGVVFTVELPA